MASTERSYEKVITSCLLADPSSSRTSIRMFLTKLGIKMGAIHIATNAEEAWDLIAFKRPEVIFIDQSLALGRLGDVVELQENSSAPGAPRATFLITSGCSGSEASGAADENVDAVLAKPFTFENLETTILKVFEEKFYPKPEQKMINQGVELLKKGNLSDALKYFEGARKKVPDSVSVACYLGEVQMRSGDLKAAQTTFEEGLRLSPAHYRCLLGLVDVLLATKDFQAAYQYAQALALAHPLPMKKIPKFVHLSILNLKFEDVLSFYKFAEEAQNVDDELAGYLGSGLVVCGLFFIRKDRKEDAANAFRKAEIISKKNPKVFARILLAMLESGLDSEISKFVKRVPLDIQGSVEFQGAYLEVTAKENPELALKTGLELTLKSPANADIFRKTLDLSFQLGRGKRSIQTLIDRAKSVCPSDKAIWSDYEGRLTQLSGE